MEGTVKRPQGCRTNPRTPMSKNLFLSLPPRPLRSPTDFSTNTKDTRSDTFLSLGRHMVIYISSVKWKMAPSSLCVDAREAEIQSCTTKNCVDLTRSLNNGAHKPGSSLRTSKKRRKILREIRKLKGMTFNSENSLTNMFTAGMVCMAYALMSSTSFAVPDYSKQGLTQQPTEDPHFSLHSFASHNCGTVVQLATKAA